MNKMKRLAKLLEEIENDIMLCVKCGTCQAACPLYSVTKQESDVARGKLALLEGLRQNIFLKPGKTARVMDKCLLCGSCAATCPSNVNIFLIFIKARIILRQYSEFSFFKKIIFRAVISHPARFDFLIVLFKKIQFLFLKSDKNKQKTASFLFNSLFSETRHVKKLAKTAFLKSRHASQVIDHGSRYKVAFFPGCAIDKIYPKVAIDTVKILNHHKIDMYIPDNQACCGIPALAGGDEKSFNRLLNHNIDLFSLNDFDFLITPCATCLSAIKDLWPCFYKTRGEKQKRYLLDLSENAMDVSEFLINVLDVADIKGRFPDEVTYHDPCHHKKALNIWQEPRMLIRRSGLKLIEMEKPDLCCGMGGTFNLMHYSESMDIGRKKRKSINRTGCSMVATSCPACMMQLSDLLAGQGSSVEIKHPVELYKKALLN